MKRSEFVSRAQFSLLECLPATDAAVMHSKLHEAAEVAAECIAWDPEEPEVLWEGRSYRITASGHCQFLSYGNWCTLADPHPAMAELARRLLEEHKQQEALDEHNDKMEEEDPAKVIRWLREDVAQHEDRQTALDRGLGDLDSRLTRVEEDLLLVRGQAAHVDEREAGDYEATRIRLEALEARPMLGVAGDPPGDRAQVALHYEEWRKLVAVYELWGPEGTMRERLASCSGATVHPQLRSELLALPDVVKS